MMQKNIPTEYFVEPEHYIPKGSHCYTFEKKGEVKIKTCPFWDLDVSKPEKENGYCHYLQKGDADLKTNTTISVSNLSGEQMILDEFSFEGLLWVKCKECNVNL